MRSVVSQSKTTVVPGAVAVARKDTTALDALLRPRSIAIVGASAREGSFGQRLLNSINGGRYRGAVYPINPRYDELAGHRCYPSLKALPEVADCAAFAVSDDVVEAALTDAAEAGVRGAGPVWPRL